MRISTFWYCLKEGVKNICRNVWFSLASVATISACIFLFCLFFSIIVNIQHVVKNAEGTIGITVFFDEELSEDQIRQLGTRIGEMPQISDMEFTSAEEAWESMKNDYFAGHEELAEGFADDNPLAGSASYQIFLRDITTQDEVVEALTDGQRGTVIVGETTLYATMGGQQGDTGLISGADGEFKVEETIKLQGGKVGHVGVMEKGMLH